MSWQPAASASPLVDCSVMAREGVRFDLYVTDEHVCYSRINSWTFKDPLETVIIPRASIVRAQLKKKSPWFLRFIGLCLVAGTTFGIISFMSGGLSRFPLKALIGYVLGGACFFGSSNRWQLTFSDGKKLHKLVQPVASGRDVMHQMANALQQTARLLSPEPARMTAKA